jgi:hypothetical protein
MVGEHVEQPAPDSMALSTVPDTNLEEHPRTFTLFPTLPTELKLKIWRTSTHNTRFVKWIYGEKEMLFINEAGVSQGKWHYGNQSTDTVPSILHVTRESREEAL